MPDDTLTFVVPTNPDCRCGRRGLHWGIWNCMEAERRENARLRAGVADVVREYEAAGFHSHSWIVRRLRGVLDGAA